MVYHTSWSTQTEKNLFQIKIILCLYSLLATVVICIVHGDGLFSERIWFVMFRIKFDDLAEFVTADIISIGLIIWSTSLVLSISITLFCLELQCRQARIFQKSRESCGSVVINHGKLPGTFIWNRFKNYSTFIIFGFCDNISMELTWTEQKFVWTILFCIYIGKYIYDEY